MEKEKISIFWHRRDLRVADNHGLYRALTESGNVLPVFVFDTDILGDLEDKDDRRVTFIHQCVERIKSRYEEKGGTMKLFFSSAENAFRRLLDEFEVQCVYANCDYEPYALQRDGKIADLLRKSGSDLKIFKDQVIFEKGDVLKADGSPYVVYTPYARKWREQFTESCTVAYGSEHHLDKLYRPAEPMKSISLKETGFEQNNTHIPDFELGKEALERYAAVRDFPGENGTLRTGHHLRFGTVSIREVVRRAIPHSPKWVSELIWREFYMMILYHFPRVVSSSFKPAYDRIQWRNNEAEFKRWCAGDTGYPLVDAGMRELNETGFMHNRVRMVTASFLTKHLLTHWSRGEAYFARKLLDYELSSNNGGWQWAAGSGCDAAPYFRVFNPELQMKRFDPDLKYIKKYVPEYDRPEYVRSKIVPHKEARERALERYKEVLNNKA